jgi:hypothetical protein
MDSNAALVGALITTEPILTIEAVKQGCEYEQQRQKLFRTDYLQSLEMLECCAAISTSVATFTNALELFHQGVSAQAVRAALSKYQKFKTVLPSPPKHEFAVPAPPKKMLGKRGEPEKVATTEAGTVIETVKGKVMPKSSQ